MMSKAKLRFAKEFGVSAADVKLLVELASRAKIANEHWCNGDPHPSYPNASDKSFNSARWGAIVDDLTRDIEKLMKPYGFTGVEYTGLAPTLKRGGKFVEVPF